MDFHGSINEKKQIQFPNTQITLRQQWLNSLKPGTNVIETIKRVQRGKTWKQCKTVFGLAFMMIVNEFEVRGWDCSMLLNLPEPTGVSIDKDMLLMFFYALFPVYEDDRRITLSKMNTVQAADFYNKIQDWSASQWSIIIPDPRPELAGK